MTLVRFDAAEYALFTINLRRIADQKHTSTFIDTTRAVPVIRETVNMDQIKCGCSSIKALNPNVIGPALSVAKQPLFESVSF